MAPIRVEPLTQAAFSSFGDVIHIPDEPGRMYFDDALGSLRPHARASLSTLMRSPSPPLPIRIDMLERHEFSSQTFIPLGAVSWLVVVAPHAAGGKPDTSRARAFLATGSQGVTYRANTWHHSLTVFDAPSQFAVYMWRDGTADDEEFVPVSSFTVSAA
jgi:ureidoglycolate lyase